MRILNYLLGLLMVWIGTVSLSAEVSAEDWARFRGPQANGISTETSWRTNWSDRQPAILWQASVGTGFSSIAVQQGRAYTIGNHDNVDTVVCLDCETGDVIWKQSYASPTDPNEFEGGPTSTPTIDEDRVYTLGRRGDLFCFNKQTGDIVWQTNVADEAEVRIPAWGFAGSPLVHGDLLILNVGDAGTAVEKQSGKMVWSSTDKDAGYATPFLLASKSDPRVVIGSARSYVCLDPRDGSEIWRQRWLTTFGCNAADPIEHQGKLFLSSGYNRGSALLDLEPNPPSVIWKHKDFQNQLSSSVLIGGFVFGVHGDVDAGASLRCIEWETGQVRWTSEDLDAGAISAAGDRLLILSVSGELLVATATPERWELIARMQVLDEKCWTAPVISDGKIYCRGASGTLVCVDVTDAADTDGISRR